MDRVPLPDVTGLRIDAHSRAEFGRSGPLKFGCESLDTGIALDAVAAADALAGAPGAAVCAAWGAMLLEYLAHEVTCAGFDVVSAAGVRAVSVAAGAASAAEVARRVAHALGGAPCAVRGPASVYLAAGAGTEAIDSAAAAACAADAVLVAHGTDALVLSLLAVPAIHVHGSARMQLAQCAAALERVVHAPALPLVPDMLAPALQALSNPHPAVLDTDMGPAGVAHERLEDQFFRRAAAQPDVPALECTDLAGTVTWTYAELAARADAVSAQVRGVLRANADGDTVVVLCMHKSMDMYAAILGVLRAGATWCPIDTGWPTQRRAALLHKAGACAVLVGDAADAADIAPDGVAVVVVDTAHPPAPPVRAPPSALAYKIWTSGTTGLPKAVGIEHTAAVQGMRALQAAVPTAGASAPGALRFLQFAAYVFDLSIFDMFYAWGHGGTVCFAPADVLVTQLARVARALRVTHTLLTPAVSALLPRRAVPTMRVLINGGEKLSQAVADEWTAACRLVNIYGPAEATLSLTMRELPPGDEVKAHNIGAAFATALTAVVDAHGRIVPRGCIGELLLGGPQLARGYIGDADKTADRFFVHDTLGRLYRTGDLARQLWDGQLEYLGRNDDQVKINGVRIELLEINAAVKSAAADVRDADTAALPVGDELRIVSFVVVPGGAALARVDAAAAAVARAVRAGTHRMLPSYMVPAHICVLSEFPRTSSAKIDRRAVRAAFDALDLVAWESAVAGSGGADIDSPLARAARREISRLLDIPAARIGAHVPLAALGLNSIRAMRVSAALVADGFSVSTADIVRHGTLAALVHAVEHAPADAAARAAKLAARTAAAEAAYGAAVRAAAPGARARPATPLQQSMLLESALDARRYWLCREFALARAPAVPLERALARLCADVEVLRTGFVAVDGARGPFADAFAAAVWPPTFVPRIFDTAEAPAAALARLAPSAACGMPPVVVLRAPDSLTLCLHHALYDAQSLELIVTRLDAALQGAALPPSLPFSSALAAALPLDRTAEEHTLAAWATELAAYPRGHRIAFPTLSDGDAAAPAAGFRRLARPASTAWAALERTAARLGTSVRPIAQLAWAHILCAYMDTRTLLLGDVVSQRNQAPELEHVCGPLLATLAVPIDLRDAAPAADAVARLAAFHARVQEHAAVPLAYVRELAGVPAERPLFEALFSLEVDADAPPPRRILGAARDHCVHVEHALALEVRVERGTLVLALNWHPALVSAAYADLILRQVDAKLSEIACGTHMPDDLLAESALVPAATPPHLNVADWVPHWAARRPDACAVEVLDDVPPRHTATLTYAELDAASARLAAALQRQCAPHAVVAVDLARSPATYIALVAVLRAGMVYLPLDESLPAARKRMLVDDSRAACIVAAQRADTVPPTVGVDGGTFEGGCAASTSTSTPAYILYTSGSTGTPKGCILTHANLAAAIGNLYAALDEAAPGSFAGARYLARSAEAFDVHLAETFMPLMAGATVVTMPRAALLTDLADAIRAARATHACVVPSLFTSGGRRIEPADVPTLRALTIGGEKLPPDVVRTWGDCGVPMLNAYGPTEAAIGISTARVHAASRASVIGRAFPGNQFVVFADARRRVALRGEPGELVIVGTHVGAGYVGRASEAFFEWRGRPAYATGDLARLSPADCAEFLGRLGSSQVKVRGARVELDEIDAAARAASGMHAAAVVATHPTHADARLVAFVAARSAGEAPALAPALADTARHVHAALRRTLSSYMVPSAVLPLTCIPLAGVSAKTDRQALVRVYAALTPPAADGPRPAHAAERALAAAVASVLPAAADAGLDTDLGAAGLDSLSAVRIARALQRIGRTVAPADVLMQPTLRGLAEASAERGPSAADAQHWSARVLPRLQAAAPDLPMRAAWPCMPLQAAMLAASLAAPAERLYVNHVRVPTGSDADATARAWLAALAQHEIYSSVVRELDGRAVLVALDTAPTLARVRGACDAAARAAVADDILAHLAHVPPLRVVLFDDVLCVSMHHALYDAVSFAALQAAASAPEAPAPAASAPHYAQFALYVDATLAASTSFWTEELADAAFAPFPNATGRVDAPGDIHETAYTVPGLAALEAAARSQRTTLHTAALTAAAAVIQQYIGEPHITLGVVLSGRLLPDIALGDVHGPCVTTVPFSFGGGSAADTAAWLARALRHQFIDIPRVCRALGRPAPLFDVLFSFQPTSTGTLADEMRTDQPLAVEVAPAGDSLDIRIVAADDRLAPRQAHLFAQQVGAELQRILLGAAPPAHLLAVANPSPVQPRAADAFLAQFAARAAEHPHKPALVFAQSIEPLAHASLTYGEVAARSDAYARRLAALPGSVLFVHLPRSLEFYVAVIAAWKACKTYVPLDPTLPAERLAYMIDVVSAAYGEGTLLTAGGPPPFHGTVVTFDDLCTRAGSSGVGTGAWADHPPAPADPLALPSYILFTSGSTGKPKGVQISHRALAGALVSWRAMLPFTPRSRILQLASPGFDVSLIELCMPLAFGYTMASAPKHVILEDLERTLRALAISIAVLPAALVSLVHPANVPPLEWILSGGDVIDDRVLQTWGAMPHKLINAYGPTESTIGNTLGWVDRGTRRSVVGQLYLASSLYVLRAGSDQPVYAGGVGELVFGGPQVGDGYVGAAELTAAKFPTLPDGARVYRTGDRGRLLADGNIECLGRMERGQVKINGQRVELDEIAAELAAEDGVAEAAVLYIQHPKLPARQLVAFLSSSRAPAPPHALDMRTDSEALAAAAAAVHAAGARLAAYMIPAHTLMLGHALPLTPSNKTDTARLGKHFTAMDLSQLRALHPTAAEDSAAGPRERTILAVLERITGITPAGDDLFYALGIDSLSAIRVVRELGTAGIATSVNQLLERGTARRLAAAKDTRGKSTAFAELTAYAETHVFPAVRMALGHVAALLPCSPLQSGMLSRTLASGGTEYMYRHVLTASAAPECVAAAWRKLVAQNTILRTSFHFVDDARMPWVQAVHEETAPEVHVVEGSALDGAVSSWLDSAAERLAAPPHALFVSGDASSANVVLCMHHALYDAHALGELLDDLDACLGGAEIAARPPFAALLPSLVPSDADAAYWRSTLEGFVRVPLLSAATTDSSGVSASLTTQVRMTAVHDACQRLGVSTHALATLAYAVLLSELCATDDVCFGQVVSLRGVRDGERVLGPAINTIATRVRVGGSAAAQLRALQDATDRGREHRHAALRDVHRDAFDALLDVQQINGDVQWQRLALVPAADARTYVQYTLNVAFVQRPDTLALDATALAAFAGPERLQCILHRLSRIVEEIATRPDLAQGCVAPATRPGPASTPSVPDAPPLAPEAHAIATRIAALVQEILGLEDAIDVHTPLVAAGLDSIAAIRVAMRARAAGLPVQVHHLGALASPADVALALSRKAASGGGAVSSGNTAAAAAALRLPESAVERVLPLTAGQAMQLALSVFAHGRTGSFSFVYRLAQLDMERLAHAWVRLQERHALLRSVFCVVGGASVQVVCRDTRPLHVEESTELVMHAAKRTIQARLDAPLLRPVAFADVVRASDGAALVLTLHHAMYDAWSLPLLISDLVAQYEGTRADVHAGIEAIYRATDVPRDTIREHWRTMRAAPPCIIGGSGAATTDTFVQHVVHTDLKAAARGINVPELIMAAWAHTLAARTSTDAPVFGVFHHGRNVPIDGIDQLAAPCLNLLPLVVTVDRDIARTAAHVRSELSARGPLEQVSTADVNAALELDSHPRFNTHLNIIFEPPSGQAHTLEPVANAGLELLDQRAAREIPQEWREWALRTCLAQNAISVDAKIDQKFIALALRCSADTLSSTDAMQILGEFAAVLELIGAK